MEDEKLLKQRIVEFLERAERMPRRYARDELFKIIQDYRLSDTTDGVLTYSDLNRIHELAISNFQDLSLPFYVDEKETGDGQRRTYCYLMAVVMYLRSIGMLKREIDVNKEVPIIEPIED